VGGWPPTVEHRGGHTTPGDLRAGLRGGATTLVAFRGGRNYSQSTPGVVAATSKRCRGWPRPSLASIVGGRQPIGVVRSPNLSF
jgi:hypothetical protein